MLVLSSVATLQPLQQHISLSTSSLWQRRVRQPGGGAASSSRAISVTIGVMVAHSVPAHLIEAHHLSAADYNARQDRVKVNLRFYSGQQMHPMVSQGRAVEATTSDASVSSSAGASLPVFVRGSFPENMNAGKTREWFRYAVSAFSTSAMVIKMDVDVVVKWDLLEPHFVLANATSELYLGRVNDFFRCGQASHCPPHGCTDFSNGCWVYMSGGFYGVSLEVAKRLADCKFFARHFKGDEDLMTGLAIKACSPDPSRVKLAKFQAGTAWCHNTHANATSIRHGLFPPDCTK